MIAAFAKGDTEAAMALNARLVESWEFQGNDDAPNPVPTKAMLRALGLPAGQCRLPMGPSRRGSPSERRRFGAVSTTRPSGRPSKPGATSAAEAR